MRRLLVVLLSLLPLWATAEDRTVKLTSREWPPYVGSTLSDGGTVTETVRRAFAAVGYLYIRWDDADTAKKLATGDFDPSDLMP